MLNSLGVLFVFSLCLDDYNISVQQSAKYNIVFLILHDMIYYIMAGHIIWLIGEDCDIYVDIMLTHHIT